MTTPPLEPHFGLVEPAPGLCVGLSRGLAPAGSSQLLAALLPVLQDGGALAALPRIGGGRRSVVARLVVDGRAYAVKRYEHPRAFLLRTFLRRSRARREADALGLLAAAVANPVGAVAWAEQRFAGLVPRSYLVTTELERAVDLRCLRRHPDEAVRARVLEHVAAALPARVAALHAADVFAVDLYAKNVLVQVETGTVAFIDLPDARVERPLPEARRVFDLACLHKELRHTVPAAAWSAWVRAYAAALGRPWTGGEASALARIEAVADSLANRTPLAAATARLKRWLRRTRLGELVTGHRYAGEASP